MLQSLTVKIDSTFYRTHIFTVRIGLKERREFQVHSQIFKSHHAWDIRSLIFKTDQLIKIGQVLKFEG